MTSVLFVAISIVLAILLYLLLRLFSITQFQAKKIDSAELRLESEKNDLATLIVSADGMDEKILFLEQRLMRLEEKLSEIGKRGQRESSYHSAIRQAQSGVGFQKLVDDCNISREEADLIVRLYGSDEAAADNKDEDWTSL